MSRYEIRKSSFGSLDAYELIDSAAAVQAVVVPAVGSNMMRCASDRTPESCMSRPQRMTC